MPVPKEILQVPRPENTVVYSYGKHKDRYAVREKLGTAVNKDGRRRPVYGKVVGHIINKMFIAKKESEIYPDLDQEDGISIKEWGASELCDRIAQPIFLDLGEFFNFKEAASLYCMAILKVLKPGIKDSHLQKAFRESWLSQLYPMAALSKNSVSALLERVGQESYRIVQYIQKQASTLKEDDMLAVDGTLKRNNSKVNTYSKFSRNYYRKGELGNISILYALDLNTGLPKAFRAYPGNVSDSIAYSDFIKTNGIRSGLLIGDKAFTESAAREQFQKYPELHFLHPLKRNARIIHTLKMRKYQGVLPGYPRILYKKTSYFDKEINKRIYLYSFLDLNIVPYEAEAWVQEHLDLEPDVFGEQFDEKYSAFGTILLQSDVDLSPLNAYLLYKGRWQIELMMRLYKQAIQANITRVHGNYSILGAEFVNFLALSIEIRLRNYLVEKGVLTNKEKLKSIIHELKGAEKEKRPGTEEWQLKTLSNKDKALLQTLGLIPPEPAKRRGRPPRVKNSSAAKAARREAHAQSQQPAKRGRGRPPGAKNKKTLERERLLKLQQQKNPAIIPVKRGRGRPPGAKNKKTLERERLQALQQQENPVLTTAEAKVESVTKRKRGRPPGAKNKKIIERERQAALKKAAREQQASFNQTVTSPL